jgi:hypothetical protein
MSFVVLGTNIQIITNVSDTLLNARHGCAAERLQEKKSPPLPPSLYIGLFFQPSHFLVCCEGTFFGKKKVLSY